MKWSSGWREMLFFALPRTARFFPLPKSLAGERNEPGIMFMFTLSSLPENSPKKKGKNKNGKRERTRTIYHANRHSVPQIACCVPPRSPETEREEF